MKRPAATAGDDEPGASQHLSDNEASREASDQQGRDQALANEASRQASEDRARDQTIENEARRQASEESGRRQLSANELKHRPPGSKPGP